MEKQDVVVIHIVDVAFFDILFYKQIKSLLNRVLPHKRLLLIASSNMPANLVLTSVKRIASKFQEDLLPAVPLPLYFFYGLYTGDTSTTKFNKSIFDKFHTLNSFPIIAPLIKKENYLVPVDSLPLTFEIANFLQTNHIFFIDYPKIDKETPIRNSMSDNRNMVNFISIQRFEQQINELLCT